MRVLIVIKRGVTQRYLLRLCTDEHVLEVRDLINRKRHAEAITSAFMKGLFEREVHENEIHKLDTDLILSEESASWDLTIK